MRDPVNDFEIPEEWLEKSALPRAEVEDLVTRGLIVVLSDGSFLKRGFTTGTTAAAAAKAATLSLKKPMESGTVISVPTPIGLRAETEIEYAKSGEAGVRKVYNDHESDITRDVLFCATVKKTDSNDPEFISEKAVDNIFVTGGRGVGIIQRAGFETRVGEYAINPKPLAQIYESVKESLKEIDLFDDICVRKEYALIVTISIPEGVELSRKTLNEKIGIVGGISILGTTGFVEPWNDHLGEMKDILIQDSKKLVLTTGRQGMAVASMLFPGYDIIMVGSRITEGIDAAVSAEEIIVCGLPGLIIKWGNPDVLQGTKYATVAEMMENDDWPAMQDAFLAAVKKGRGARIVIIERDGTVYRDSDGKLDSWRYLEQ